MKKLAEFAARVKNHLIHSKISNDDVMGMTEMNWELLADMLNDNKRARVFQPTYRVYVCVDSYILRHTKNLMKSLNFEYFIEDDYPLKTSRMNGEVHYIVIGKINLQFKTIKFIEFKNVYKKRKWELMSKFFRDYLDFEKTIAELKKVENMWSEDFYLNVPVFKECNETTFENLLKTFTIYERQHKITEILTN